MQPGVSDGTEPVRKKANIAASPDVAFHRFTAEMTEWWHLGSYSVNGDGGTVEFGAAAGEGIVEHGPGGESSVWGTILEWDPPRKVRFTWHPGRPPTTADEVEVTFLSTGESTEVTLVHTGWTPTAESRQRRRRYESGWDELLTAYRDSV